MKHPQGRAERRFNGEVWRNSRRFIMKNLWWSSRREDQEWFVTNNMWWARKQSSAHGNRCMCHYEKNSPKFVRARRNGKDVKSQRRTMQLLH